MKTTRAPSLKALSTERQFTRREMLASLAGMAGACALQPFSSLARPADDHGLGVCSISYALRWPAVNAGQASADQVIEFIEHCRQSGAGGIQTSIRPEPGFISAIRTKVESANLFLEGQLALPRSDADLDRFERQVQAAREAGAGVLRTACLSGRRYETFKDAASFRKFAEESQRSLERAEPIVRKARMRLAVENHKDWRVPDLLGLLQRISSEYVGVCVDTGNSIALLEDPLAVVEAYAPYAFATHLKDMAVQEYEHGFLLSEVPLGDGFLDLSTMVASLRRAKPGLHFSLEMIARDPLSISCLARPYWATFEALPGRFLAATLAMVRANSAKQPLPQFSALTSEEKLRAEDNMVRRSLAYARTHLAL